MDSFDRLVMIDDLEHKVNDLEEILADKDQELKNLEKEISKLKEEIDSLQVTIEDKDDYIAEIENELNENEERIIELMDNDCIYILQNKKDNVVIDAFSKNPDKFDIKDSIEYFYVDNDVSIDDIDYIVTEINLRHN